MTDVVITAAKRTPVGSFLGAFAGTPRTKLGRIAIEAALAQAGVAPGEVSEVILAGADRRPGPEPAAPGLDGGRHSQGSPRLGVNQVCGSGLRAGRPRGPGDPDGDARIVVAGGQESMSLSPHAQFIRGGTKWRPQPHRYDDQGRPHRRLQRLSHGRHRGEPRPAISDHARRAGRVCRRLAEQASAARAEGRFRDEIAGVTLKTRKGETLVEQDEYIRDGVEQSALAGLRPAFRKEGTVTAGNASGLTTVPPLWS